MKILVTGGLGFIGSHLSESLINQGHEVTILSRSNLKIDNIKHFKDKVELLIKDVKEIKDEVKNFDVIFHLAGSTDNYAIIEDDLERDIELNCKGILYLLNSCKKHNPKIKIIFASTFFVVGIPEKLPVDETARCKPLSLYPATRLCGEHICNIYHNVYGLDIIIARFANVFGEREQCLNKKKAAFNFMINTALNDGELTLYDSGDIIRDYIHVKDVVDACITLMEKGVSNEVYFVGRGEGIEIRKLFEMVINIVGSGKIKNIPTPNFHKKVGIRDFYCDISKISKLGWKPKISIEEGIKLTADYYKNMM